jgi:hypothetical protein
MLFDLAPLVLAALLGASGGGKLAARSLAVRAGDTALARLLGTPGRAAAALRLVGAAEVLLAGALLLARPGGPAAAAGAGIAGAGIAGAGIAGAGIAGAGIAGTGAAVLGAGFLGYLAWARLAAPDSSCGCAGRRHEPITWRAFARAALVVAGGVAATRGDAPWWSAAAAHPAGAAALLAGTAAAFAALSTDLDHRWLLPLRQARIRLFGHPLAGTGGTVPLAATVELLERSLAWESAVPLVRSARVEHWDADGWRVLRYTGMAEGRPVSVLFALSAAASSATASEPVVRVSVLDETAVPAPA